MGRQERRLPQVAPFTLPEQERGVGGGAKSKQYGRPQQDRCHTGKPGKAGQPEYAAERAVGDQDESAPRQPRFTLRRENDPQESFFVVEIPNQQQRRQSREQERNRRQRDIADPIA